MKQMIVNIKSLRKYIRLSGITIMLLGVLLLVCGYYAGWTNSNVMLWTCATLIIVGAVLHVLIIKKESGY